MPAPSSKKGAPHIANYRIVHDGKVYKRGQQILLTDKDSAALVKVKAVQKIGAPAEPAPEAPKE